MKNTKIFAALMLTSVAITDLVWSQEMNPPSETPFQDLLTQYPGVKVHVDEDPGHISWTIALYGRAMAQDATPALAVQRWLKEDAVELAAAGLDLRVQRSNKVGQSNTTVFALREFIAGVPVENGFARILVSHGPPSRVLYVGAKLAQVPLGGFGPDTVEPAAAQADVQQMPAHAGLTEWGQPEMVIFYGDSEPSGPIRAWKFRGSHPTQHQAYTFFVDAATGELAHVRDNVHHVDITGHVNAKATPGVQPDVFYNPPTEEMDMVALRVQLLTGNPTTFTDASGDYLLSCDQCGSTVVEADLVGQWVTVHNNAGSGLHLEAGFPPIPVDFQFNSTPDEFSTAQVNAFIHATLLHDFWKKHQPDFVEIDFSLDLHVNDPILICDGVFHDDPTDPSITLSQDDGECANTAYSSVIAHEYGHFVRWAIGFQGLGGIFEEGFCDSLAVLVYDDPLIARDNEGPCTFWRDIEGANIQFPCAFFDLGHFCGQLLAGVWWDIKLQMQASLGQAGGLEQTWQLFTDWSLITMGADQNQSAGPQTVIEILVVDDCAGDPQCEGDFDDMTPYWTEICAGFAAHNIPCPIADCNHNGVNDEADISGGTSNDCNGNGIPDECGEVCTTNEDCDDGIACNGAETCDSQCCMAGQPVGCFANPFFCDGEETCDPVLGCVSAGDPCAPQGVCDEQNDRCDFCISDSECDDGQFCNGMETCIAQFCMPGEHAACPCELCDEVNDVCFCNDNDDCNDNDPCTTDFCNGGSCEYPPVLCDDGVACTDDSCDAGTGSCINTPNDSNCEFCNGETCYATFGCRDGRDPDCDDGVFCTDDSCNEATDSCDNIPNDSHCSGDQWYCNGISVCDLLLDCQTVDPCDDGLVCTIDECDETNDVCFDDGNSCFPLACEETFPYCSECLSDIDCDDGLYCTGVETCDTNPDPNDCVSGSSPCTPGEACDESTDTCFECQKDLDCDDGFFCNGAESCSIASSPRPCVSGSDPCPGQTCNETTDVCE